MSKIERKESSYSLHGTLGCVARLGWMAIGTIALLAALLFIVQNRGKFNLADSLFWAAVVVCIGLRYLDIAHLNGETVAGEPATLAHWRRYALILIALALPLWALAHGIGFLLR
ncbi:MAG: hypothetical protein NTX50_02220 [Candidatus Sumerlaeota bacterium]|nr:hypothetical protein [Candidatus Sumerlaeota bacterium]